jgi:ABC-type glycerol-3-phosphate transport system substrate-binding protein
MRVSFVIFFVFNRIGEVLMKRITSCSMLIALSALILTACGGGGGGGGSITPPTPTSHTVNLSWTANREVAVNTTGGGYTVAISGQPTINVPYVSGPTAPTSTSTTLMSGSYSVTVRGYSALNSAGSVSATYSFTVPY